MDQNQSNLKNLQKRQDSSSFTRLLKVNTIIVVDEKVFYLGFALANDIGPSRFGKLLNYFGSAKAAWSGSESELRAAGLGPKTLEKFKSFRDEFNYQVYLEKLRKTKTDFIALCDSAYPEGLKKLPNPPTVLFVKGDKSCLENEKTIGVVGARKMTSYGESVTESLVSELVGYGFVIISGMALGVDATAHNSSLKNKGQTIAVLGCGVDCPFPKENERLYEEILDGGGLIVSEYPLGMEPMVGSFPARNRIIAALSLGVLVSEAGEDSGSLITAEWAKRLGKPIFAVPGPITSYQSKGAIKLLKEGGTLVQSAEDILKIINPKSKILNSKQILNFNKLKLTREEREVLSLLQSESMDIDEISKKVKFKIMKLNIILSDLEMRGILKNDGGKFILS